MELLYSFADLILHLDKHLDLLLQHYGNWSYVILFLIIFCETGLVVTPILPGDSLLFAAGALAGRGQIDVHLLFILLFIAAVLGNTVNYAIGRYIGPKAFQNPNSRIFKKHYLERTAAFYEKYGGKTIIITRFVPIVRTFAPFMAGVGKMPYVKFMAYNISGGLFWIGSLTYAGYLFGEQPIVKNNFGLVIIGIIVVSLIPAVVEAIKARSAAPSN